MDPEVFKERRIGHFILKKEIGKGGFSTVCLAEEINSLDQSKNNNLNEKNKTLSSKDEKENNESSSESLASHYVACKIIPKKSVEECNLTLQLAQEIKVHRLMNHPNIIHLLQDN